MKPSALVQAILEGHQDCDIALEHHLHEVYEGKATIPSMPEVHLAICCANMGCGDRMLDLPDGPMSVFEIIKEFGLESFLPLFDRQEGSVFRKGDVVWWCNYNCRVLGRREVTYLAALRTDDWELFLETTDGSISGFVGESEVTTE